MKLLVKQGHLVDPATKTDKVCDILVEKGKIKEVATTIKPTAATEIIAPVLLICMSISESLARRTRRQLRVGQEQQQGADLPPLPACPILIPLMITVQLPSISWPVPMI